MTEDIYSKTARKALAPFPVWGSTRRKKPSPTIIVSYHHVIE